MKYGKLQNIVWKFKLVIPKQSTKTNFALYLYPFYLSSCCGLRAFLLDFTNLFLMIIHFSYKHFVGLSGLEVDVSDLQSCMFLFFLGPINLPCVYCSFSSVRCICSLSISHITFITLYHHANMLHVCLCRCMNSSPCCSLLPLLSCFFSFSIWSASST